MTRVLAMIILIVAVFATPLTAEARGEAWGGRTRPAPADVAPEVALVVPMRTM
jgi:hypothetical protein